METKKIITILLLCCLLGTILSGCQKENKEKQTTTTLAETTSAESVMESVAPDEPESIIETITTPEATAIEKPTTAMTVNAFTSQIQNEIKGSLSARDKINSITLENRNLLVSVSLEKNNVTLDRFSSITDKILGIENGYELWDSITVDFGSLGYITKSKDDIVTNNKGSHFLVEKTDIVK